MSASSGQAFYRIGKLPCGIRPNYIRAFRKNKEGARVNLAYLDGRYIKAADASVYLIQRQGIEYRPS
jgi:hypothetical protein